MTHIDFYTVDTLDAEGLLLLACRFIEQAYKAGRRVHVQAADEASAHALDETLWAFEPTSFVPHNLAGEGPTPPPPVQIGWGDGPVRHTDLLVNLCTEVPTALFGRFSYVAEFIPAEETAKQHARDRYRFYRDRGYPLRVHPRWPHE